MGGSFANSSFLCLPSEDKPNRFQRGTVMQQRIITLLCMAGYFCPHSGSFKNPSNAPQRYVVKKRRYLVGISANICTAHGNGTAFGALTATPSAIRI